MNAATAACKVFGLEAKPYMPHCSLLYSDVSLEDRCVSTHTHARTVVRGSLCTCVLTSDHMRRQSVGSPALVSLRYLGAAQCMGRSFCFSCTRSSWWFIGLCRQKVAEEARERLYGAMQSYQGLLTTTSFEAKALHLYETPFPADEATWKEVAVFALPEKK